MVTQKNKTTSEQDLFHYDLSLIKKDLLRTGGALLVVVTILVALYFQL
jgi:hypothetical protein